MALCYISHYGMNICVLQNSYVELLTTKSHLEIKTFVRQFIHPHSAFREQKEVLACSLDVIHTGNAKTLTLTSHIQSCEKLRLFTVHPTWGVC